MKKMWQNLRRNLPFTSRNSHAMIKATTLYAQDWWIQHHSVKPYLKKFAAYYKPYKKFFFLDLFCATIISAVDLAFPQILRRAASDWFTRGQEAILRSLPLLFAGLLM